MAECRARTTAARMLCLSLRIRILLFPPPESRAVAYRDALSFTFVFRFSPCPRTWMSITCLFIDGEHHFLSLSLIYCHCLRERNRERERESVCIAIAIAIGTRRATEHSAVQCGVVGGDVQSR